MAKNPELMSPERIFEMVEPLGLDLSPDALEQYKQESTRDLYDQFVAEVERITEIEPIGEIIGGHDDNEEGPYSVRYPKGPKEERILHIGANEERLTLRVVADHKVWIRPAGDYVNEAKGPRYLLGVERPAQIEAASGRLLSQSVKFMTSKDGAEQYARPTMMYADIKRSDTVSGNSSVESTGWMSAHLPSDWQRRHAEFEPATDRGRVAFGAAIEIARLLDAKTFDQAIGLSVR